MSRLPSRKLKWIAIAVFGIFVLAIGSWLGYHLWPREMPAPLYPVHLFDVPVPAQNNAANEYKRLEEAGIKLKMPEDVHPQLDELYLFPEDFSKRKTDEYWEKVAHLQPKIQSYFQNQATTFNQYLKVREMPLLADENRPILGSKQFGPIEVLFSHRILNFYLLSQTLEGKSDVAYELWRKAYVQDLSFLQSARPLINYMVALAQVDGDFSVLRLMIARHPPANRAEWVQWLKSHPPQGFDLNRPLRFEYLISFHALESVQDELPIQKKYLLNKALVRRDLNAYYGQIEKILKGPPSLWQKELATLHANSEKITQERFWWLSNPIGKVILSFSLGDYSKISTDFTQSRNQINHLFSEVIAELQQEPHTTPPPAPDLAKEETGEAETKPLPSPPATPQPAVPSPHAEE